ncbi:MAG: leucine-rich repeat protein [Oscillospiraceae bacterium]
MEHRIKRTLRGSCILGTAALIAALTACTAEQTPDSTNAFDTDPRAVHIAATAGNGTATRSNPESDDIQKQQTFNAGDRIEVSAEGKTVTYVASATASAISWKPAVEGEYLLWPTNGSAMEMAMEMTACYPATSATTATTFQLPAQQDGAAGTGTHISQADYMNSSSRVFPGTDNTADIHLTRQTARVQIVLSYAAQLTDKARCSITVNSLYGGIPTTSYPNVTAVTGLNAAHANKDTTVTALVIPGAGLSTSKFLAITVYPNYADNQDESGSFLLTVAGIPAMEAGKSYTYRLRVGKNKAEISNVTVADWGNGTTTEGGKAERSLDVTNLTAAELTDNLIGSYVNNNKLTLTGAFGDNNNTAHEKFAKVAAYIRGRKIPVMINLDFSHTTGVTDITHQYSSGNNSLQCDFQLAESLKTVKLPLTVTNLTFAFSQCTSLTSVTGCDNVTTLSQSFFNCTSLTEVICPAATSLSDGVFYGCTALKDIRLTAARFIYVYSSESGVNPFSDIKNRGNVTLHLNASQEGKITTNGTTTCTWTPVAIAGDFKQAIDLAGFKAVYCGEKQVYLRP